MSTPAPKDARSLEDYASFLRLLAAEAISFAVIGGCAVGAYAHLRGLRVFSTDLDVYTSPEDLRRIVDLVRRKGVTILNLPRPRAVPVAAFAWEGNLVNVLSSSLGLPEAPRVSAAAREFKVRASGDLPVPIADPYDLLANKLAVNRPKDRPHAVLLRDFIEEEIVESFRTESGARSRFLPARRYLDVTGDPALSNRLFRRLIPLARLATDFRFLAGQAPTRALADSLIRRAPAALKEEIRQIVARQRASR